MPKNHEMNNISPMEQNASQEMINAINQIMPFGKYKGQKLLNLPEPYLVWFNKQGFPDNKLGEQLALMYEIKLNGIEGMFKRYLYTNL